MKQVATKVRDQPEARIHTELWKQIGHRVQTSDKVWASIRPQIGSGLRYIIYNQLCSKVSS